MEFSPFKWWTSNTALHSYIFAQLLISLPFSVFSTYVQYQLQITGFVIGTDSQGQPCTTYCIVEWAGSRLDLNSVLLYLNAFGIGLGGSITLFLSAYSDHWSRKHLIVTLLFITYGSIAIPTYWLQGLTQYNFNVLTGLQIVFTIVTNMLVAILNIYIPYCMRVSQAQSSSVRQEGDNPVVAPEETYTDDVKANKRTFGFKMSVKGALANSIGALVMYVIVIIITETLPEGKVQSPGLLITTVCGFITVAGAAVTYLGLPKIPSVHSGLLKQGPFEPLIEFLRPFRDLLVRRSMAALLISYTIYTDSTYAVASVTSQLFVTEVRPGTLEISLYALTSTISGVVCTVLFLWVRPFVPIKLETWLLVGYGLLILIPVWGCIGFADVDFGFKERWEFYVQTFLITLSGVIVNSVFRVLFSEMVPTANEVRWFSLQLILSCATVWVNYVASAPLQNATHQLRFPLVLSLIFLVAAFALEVCRVVLPFFTQDQVKWMATDQASASEVSERREVGDSGSSGADVDGFESVNAKS
ncbi:hypothetical protein M409DRAFT_18545 [Zasmidium cellare ATCC 36951]|uniref:Autophagy-related protein n=1 Tax=Zasmidium cellare ATCC 36951 TaxID=1080233 RepID=A0A6A6CZ35_ZASCE|nr:uncharacterized protein M409DRAFT_18545 [Zasmidium cellare ATCC 36951]KAF2171428.1 hypothetical protein M409DRAFT_18545 [Zasmidium cellare ATCC 36951]